MAHGEFVLSVTTPGFAESVPVFEELYIKVRQTRDAKGAKCKQAFSLLSRILWSTTGYDDVPEIAADCPGGRLLLWSGQCRWVRLRLVSNCSTCLVSLPRPSILTVLFAC